MKTLMMNAHQEHIIVTLLEEHVKDLNDHTTMASGRNNKAIDSILKHQAAECGKMLEDIKGQHSYSS